jgi:hypothetical protein
MRRSLYFSIFALFQALAFGRADAHSGSTDGNGCHYEASSGRYHCHKDTKDLKPNPDVNAPVMKSRENLCHSKTSSNYKTIKYFVSYKTMAECKASGGRASG